MTDTLHVMVTVLDTATIIEGPETVYRYDLPGTGVREGWATEGVITQIRDSTGPHWPDIDVCIDAEESTAHSLREALRDHGIHARWIHDEDTMPREAEGRSPDSGPPTLAPATSEEFLPWEEDELDDEPPLSRGRARPAQPGSPRRRPGRPRGDDAPRWKSPLVLAAAVVIPICLVVSWWGLSHAFSSADAAAPPALPEVGQPATTETQGKGTSSSPPEETPPLPLRHGDIELTLPAGFRFVEDNGALRAEGEDPDVRIHLAVDPVHGVPAAEVRKEILRMVEDTEALTLSTDDPAGAITYVEDPGDHSRVEWTTWIAEGMQFSVGCHHRTGQFTMPQRAACRMAVDSLHRAGNPKPSKAV